MIDVHILLHPDTPYAWSRLCLSSVRLAIKNAGFPVELHTLPAVLGHIGQGRAHGYAMGTYPYVTCVDDDDFVLPHAFAQMREALEMDASAVCTMEKTLQNGCIRPGRQRHHLIAYRRTDIIDHTQWPCCGDVAQMQYMGDNVIDLLEPGYVHRLYLYSKARVMRRSRREELEAARG